MNSEQYKKYLTQAKVDKYNLLGLLKQEGDYNTIRKIYKQIGSNLFVKSAIKNNIAPKEYSEIRKQRNIPYSGNLIGEATWYLIALEENRKIIERFINLKKDYDTFFLLGRYDDAEQTLKQIELETGKSIWLIENRLILDEYKIGVKANWNFLSELSKEIQDPIVLLFVENLSKKAESKISYFRYRNIFTNQLNEINLDHQLFEYLCFRLNYIAYGAYDSFAFMLFIENACSLVDRYLLLKDILSELLSERFTSERESVLLLGEKLFQLFPNDTQTIQILSILKPTYLNSIRTVEKVNSLIQEYTRGNYDYCIEAAPNIIEENPQIIESYEIYVKSHIEVNKPFSKTGVSELIDNILEILHSIYSNNSQFGQDFDTGLKLSTTFYSTSWAKQFLSLINSSTNTDVNNRQFTIEFIISSQIKNPRILHYVSKAFYEDYNRQFKNEINLADTIKLLNDIFIGNISSIEENKELNFFKKQLYVGRALLNEGDFEAAKSHFEKIKSKNDLSIVATEECIVSLYRCYLQLNLLKEACELFVRHYLINEAITKRLNRESLLKKLEDIVWEELNDFIELPIFVKIASIDSYQQYVAYDVYLESLNIKRPSELFQRITNFDDKLRFFLREVCTIEIMHHSYHYSGTDDIEAERLKILNKLIVEDKSHEDIYIKEITELNQSANIRQAIREVNKGRISVNVQQLKQNEILNIKEAFARFKEIDNYSKHKDVLGIDSSTILNEMGLAMLDELIANKIVYTNDPAFISFKVIFIELRDKYILSKEYGLDGYLSTRIRHGTLLNHIRSIFESQNIISQRDKENNYLVNEFWDQAIPYSLLDKRSQLQDAIKKFSRSIDEYTESIIRDLIQVKTEKNAKKPKALFDYSLTNKELAYLFSIARENIKDHTIFLGFAFEYLERKTEAILSNVRLLLNGEIKNDYSKILQDFNTEIKKIIGTNNFPELISSINLCGTRLQNELKNISEWFYLSNTSKDLILDLGVLIQTAIQITNTIYPNSKISPIVNEEHREPMVGTIHLIYVCRILLENIIKHSKLSSSDLSIEISSSITNDEYLQLRFKNNLADSVDKNLLRTKLEKVKEKWLTSSTDFENVNVEGDSGYDKIRRIIVFDLECKKYSFDYYIEDNNLEIIISIEFIKIPEYAEGD